MRKNNRGVTLVELVLTIAIFAIVAACAGSAFYSAIESYAVTKQLQDDQYNARLALLAITREIHEGCTASVSPDNKVLTLTMLNTTPTITVTYTLDSNGNLTRTSAKSSSFVTVELESFKSDVISNRWVQIDIEGKNGLKLSTKVSISRIPAKSTT